MPRKPKFSVAEEASLCLAALSGKPLRAVASDFDTSSTTVFNILRRSGLDKMTPAPELAHLQLPYLPQICFASGNLAVVVARASEWNDTAIIRRFGATATEASLWLTHLAFHLKHSGFRLLFLWEEEWQQRYISVARMIAHKSGRASRAVNARQCEVVEIPCSDAIRFYETYHLQGGCKSKETLALRHEGTVVACMSFNHILACRGADGDHLLQRFATAANVRGAASKLLKNFRRRHSGSIISYSDERYAPGGNLYRALGFTATRIGRPDYRYWRDGVWYPKNRKQRRHLIAEGADAATTEKEMARSLGYSRCYDLGKITWRVD